jgi:hypothetical protein
MPGSMPFHLEKGPYLSVLESFCNDDRDRLVAALVSLRDPSQPVPEIGRLLESSAITSGPYTTGALQTHLYQDWFGFEPKAGGTWATVQEPFDASDNRTTGYWGDYYGNVEGIFRETLRRAAEVALGIDHDTTVDRASGAVNGSRHWPIEFFWKCGQPWWEGWVTWRHDRKSGAGQVTVVLATPSTPDDVLTDPTSGRRGPDYVLEPKTTVHNGKERRQGMWLVTHQDHRRYQLLSTTGTPFGSWPNFSLGAGYRGQGDVVVVQPAHADGGALADGLPFVPPTN